MPPSRPEVRIEFVGMPGAGKSTIFAAALEGLGERVVDRRDLLLDLMRHESSDRLVRAAMRALPRRVGLQHAYEAFYRARDFEQCYFRFAARHPELYALVVDLNLVAAADGARAWRIYQKHASVQASHQFLARARRRPDRPVLLDEEFVQMLLIGLASTAHPDASGLLDRYLALAPLPDTVVAVRAAPDRCRRRVDERSAGRGWPTIIAAGDELGFLQRMDAATDRVLAALGERGVAVVEVDNDARPPTSAEMARRLGAALVPTPG